MKVKNKKKKTERRKRKSLLLWMICLFVAGGISVSFAFAYDILYIGQRQNQINSCSFEVSFKDENAINLEAAYPMSDEEGLATEPYNFYIRADKDTCSDINYTINFYNACDTCVQTDGLCTSGNTSCNCNSEYQLDPNIIKYELKNTTNNQVYSGRNPFNLSINNTIDGLTTDNYELKMWISEEATQQDLYVYENGVIKENADGAYETKNICVKLGINNKGTNIDASEANEPELVSGMIPVYYDETNDVWKKADERNISINTRWYDYNNKIWANAVTYDRNKLYNEGSIINEGKIFNGTSTYDNMGNANYDFNNTFSAIARVKINAISNIEMYIIGNAENAGMILSVLPSTLFRFCMYSSNENKYNCFTSTDMVETGKWYTIVATYDGTNMKIYINGVLEATLEETSNIKASTQPIFVGANPSASGSHSAFFNGIISDALVIDGAVSEEEITNNYSDTIMHNKDANTIFYNQYSNNQARFINTKYEEDGAHFDGTSSYINTGNSLYDFNNTVSAIARVKLINSNVQTEIMANTELAGLGMYVNTSGKSCFYLYSVNESAYKYACSTTVIEAGKWYTIAGTYDGANMKLYVNGVLEGTLAETSAIKISSQPILIGANPSASGNHGVYFNGVISDALLIDGAISEEDIKQYYSDGFNYKKSNNELFYYNLRSYEKRPAGTEIPMEMINTMFVWIPRFNAEMPSNYNGGTSAAPGAIKVTFVEKEQEGIDAFTFGTESLNGFWVAKFELSHKTLAGVYPSTLGCDSETCTTSNELIIKPNQIPLSGNNISNFFYGIRSMEQSGNAFGFVGSEVDTHMIKNREWGAIAYLTQSIYGRCSSETTCERMGVSTASTYLATTGYGVPYGSDFTTESGSYETPFGQSASTTGNIYGVYDTSSGLDEYVMGNYNNIVGGSGFTSLPDSKYIDIYTGTSYMGHALSETGYWHGSYSSFVNEASPWFARGDSSLDGTIFRASRFLGISLGNVGTRAVITN